mmetsp:Transcript_11853/g.26964  ORF Transcript_11853/g.26964 Transcript_11853/m.26964 type:complete len:886 (+) Transcript_11853:70-2727(+)
MEATCRRLFDAAPSKDGSDTVDENDAVRLLTNLGVQEDQIACSEISSPSQRVSFGQLASSLDRALGPSAQERSELRDLFDAADSDKDGLLDQSDVIDLLRRLGISPMPGEEMEQMLSVMELPPSGKLSFTDFMEAYKDLQLGGPEEETASDPVAPPSFISWLTGRYKRVVSFVTHVHPHRRLDTRVEDELKAQLVRKHTNVVWEASERFLRQEKTQMWNFWRVLVTTAILQSMLSFVIDKLTFGIGHARAQFTTGKGVDLVIAVIFNVVLVEAARLAVRSTPDGQGSGFPEVKAMLFGKILPNFLTLRVLFTKAIALTLVVAAGLPIGKEGPNVHMAACFSATLGPQFYGHSEDDPRRRIYTQRLLLAACAVGVGTTFSAPIGGVIFALEFMLPQILDAISFWGSFVAAAVGSLCYAMLRSATSGESSLLPMMSTNLKPGEGQASRPFMLLLFTALLGMLCGFLAGVWIRMHSIISKRLKNWRLKKPAQRTPTNFNEQSKSHFVKGEAHVQSLLVTLRSHHVSAGEFEWRDLVLVAGITIVNTLVAAALPILGGKPEPVLISMLFDKSLHTATDADMGLPGGFLATLILCFVAKWFTTALALSIPIPTGAVAPTMIIGGLLGRAFFMLIPTAITDFLLENADGSAVTEDQRGAFMARFAIIGACAFASGVTRTFAMTITIFEALALPGAEMQLSVSTLLSIWVANNVSLPFFDMNLVGKGLIGIPAITSSRRRLRPVFTIMRRIAPGHCARVETTIRQLRALVATSDEDLFPIAHFSTARDGQETMRLAGSATRHVIQRILDDLDPQFSQPDMKIDLLDPKLRCYGDRELVQSCPLQVRSDTTLRDVYIIMKATAEHSIFITSDQVLVGVVYFSELLDGARMQQV